MSDYINMNAVYKPSEDVIAKSIEGQVMIVPLVSGVGNLDDELFQLNETGSKIWEMLNGKNRLSDIVDILLKQYDVPYETIEKDITNLIRQLTKKNFISETIRTEKH